MAALGGMLMAGSVQAQTTNGADVLQRVALQ